MGKPELEGSTELGITDALALTLALIRLDPIELGITDAPGLAPTDIKDEAMPLPTAEADILGLTMDDAVERCGREEAVKEGSDDAIRLAETDGMGTEGRMDECPGAGPTEDGGITDESGGSGGAADD